MTDKILCKLVLSARHDPKCPHVDSRESITDTDCYCYERHIYNAGRADALKHLQEPAPFPKYPAWAHYPQQPPTTPGIGGPEWDQPTNLPDSELTWIEWNGGDCPVAFGALIDVRYRNGLENHHVEADVPFCTTGSNPEWGASKWVHHGTEGDIIAYRKHKPQAPA